YTPFPLTTEGIHACVKVGLHGIAGNSAYPRYRFGPALLGEHTTYGRYRRDWYEVYRRFAANVLARVPDDDPDVRRWADHIAAWVPGFPSGREIAAGGALAEVVASFI